MRSLSGKQQHSSSTVKQTKPFCTYYLS